MTDILYQNMELADYPEVSALWKSTENIGLSAADQIDQIERFLVRNPVLSFVARQNRRLVGAVLCGHDGRRGAIYHLAVVDTHRRKGIGRQLVLRCLQALQSAGIERCHIHVYAQNQSGINFWQHESWFLRPELVLLSIDIDKNSAYS
ncbi:MAG: hypothetical protein BGO78_09725 [Chloroflexi bacterium 44-23]|nr:MAG: hypothetical protein BGO78_09725 [Chloroflexi bacterium 44-23]